MRDDPIGRKMAYGIVSSQFETEAIGPYFEAVCALPDPDRQRLLAMALDGGDPDNLSMGWVLGEIRDLADPFTRSMVERYVARTDPLTWVSGQSGMEGAVRAVELMAADNVALPDRVGGAGADPAWRASLTVIMASLAGVGREQELQAAWAALLTDHPDVVASLLLNLRQMHGLQLHPVKPEDVYARVLSAMPAAGIDALTRSLEHPDRIRSLCRYNHGVLGHVVDVLGRIGDDRAAEVLRRFVDDPAVGEAAAAAVRAIEARAIA